VLSPVQAQVPAGTLPSGIWTSAEAHLRAYLGDSIFVTSVRPRPEWSLYQDGISSRCSRLGPSQYCSWPWFTPYFIVFYELDPMSDPLRTGLIAVPIDTAGRVVLEFPPAGVPRCKYVPEQCRFGVTADSAIAAARRATVAGSGGAWRAQFVWLSEPFIDGCDVCNGRFSEMIDVRAAYGWVVRGVVGDEPAYLVYIEAATGAVLGAYQAGIGQQ